MDIFRPFHISSVIEKFHFLLVLGFLWMFSVGHAYAGTGNSEPPTQYCSLGLVKDSVNGLCYEKCPAGFSDKPSNGICYEKCKDGFSMNGTSCQQTQTYVKKSYTRTSTQNPYCSSYQEKIGSRCFALCYSGYVGVGDTCRQSCKEGFSDKGSQCVKSVVYTPTQTKTTEVKSTPQICTNQRKDTIYPIVLVHGFGGWGKGAVVEHMQGIKKMLEDGGATVFVPTLHPFANNHVRGQALLTQLKQYRDTMNIDKFHLIGHSQGAPASRYAAGIRPDWVVSVTTVGGVNWGTEFAEFLLDWMKPNNIFGAFALLGTEIAQKFIDANLLPSDFNYLLARNKADILEAGKALSTSGMREFNRQFPAGLGVNKDNVPERGTSLASPLSFVKSNINGEPLPILFYSWTGKQPFAAEVDPYIVGMNLAAAIIKERGGGESDGLVPVTSAMFGYYLGAYNHEHVAEINFVGFKPTAQQVSPISLWCEHAVRLKEAEMTMLVPYLLPYGFDPKKYVSLHPDLIQAGVEGTKHYLQYGRKEQRRYR